jgi:hypothetical protein
MQVRIKPGGLYEAFSLSPTYHVMCEQLGVQIFIIFLSAVVVLLKGCNISFFRFRTNLLFLNLASFQLFFFRGFTNMQINVYFQFLAYLPYFEKLAAVAWSV